jgi:hypothetical protein
MSIRRTIVLLTVPLFLALAIVNGALLYFQQRAEMSQALNQQALAAAITSAEFISSMARPEQELVAPRRAKALRAAASQIPGLDGIYLVMAGGRVQALVTSSRPWSLQGLRRPEKAFAVPADPDSDPSRHAVALAPAAGGAFVAARIDAEPMFAEMATVQRAILLTVLLAGVIAAVLAWFVAWRITRELKKNRQMVAAIGSGRPLPGDQELTIREVRDLAGAVRLMEASNKSAGERARRIAARKNRQRTVDTALAAIRAERFAPVVETIAGASVAARIGGEAASGCFFALGKARDRGIIVIGRCSGGSPQDAFSRAEQARSCIEANVFATGAEACLAAVRTEHGVESLSFIEWTAAEADSTGTRLLALTDDETARQLASYAEHSHDAAAADLLDGIELLFSPTGVFAAVSRQN